MPDKETDMTMIWRTAVIALALLLHLLLSAPAHAADGVHPSPVCSAPVVADSPPASAARCDGRI